MHSLPAGFTVLFAGRVIPRKGVPVLLRAMHRLKQHMPCHLLIAGRGKPPYVRQLKALARRLGVSVSFLGNIPHGEIHTLYQAADCFVCPSQQHESFGLVNVEAMASGLPVIASSNGGIREIITSGHNGYLVKRYRDPAAFAGRMLQIARNPALAARIGLQGRTDALERFEWQHTADLLEHLYLELVPPTSRGSSGQGCSGGTGGWIRPDAAGIGRDATLCNTDFVILLAGCSRTYSYTKHVSGATKQCIADQPPGLATPTTHTYPL